MVFVTNYLHIYIFIFSNRAFLNYPPEIISETSPLLTRSIEDSGTDDDTQGAALRPVQSYVTFPPINQHFSVFWCFLKSPEIKNVLKCTLAYFLASMIVYSPLREIFGKSQNKHMAATVAVYFHPARTAGSMYESILFVVLSLLYSLVMVSASMFISRQFSLEEHRYFGYAIDILCFCGFGLGFVAFVKQRMNKPTFNTACSVASIFLVTTLTKEGNVQAGIISFEKVLQSFNLVFSGVAISAFVCFVLWPKSAVKATKQELNKSMQISADMLRYLTNKFLDCESIHSSEFSNLKSSFDSSYQRLGKNLSDAAYELLPQGKELEYDALVRLTNSSHKLSLLFNGLSSSVLTQWSLLAEEKSSSASPKSSDTTVIDPNRTNTINNDQKNATNDVPSNNNFQFQNYSALVDENTVQQFFNEEDISPITSLDSLTDCGPATILFKQFIKTIRSTMVDYSALVEHIMSELPFSKIEPYSIPQHYNRHFLELKDALASYSKKREESLHLIYKQDNFVWDTDFESIANKEAEAASCGNFSYILEEIGNELIDFMRQLDDYQQASSREKYRRSFNWVGNIFSKSSRSNSPRVGRGSVFVSVTRHELYKEFEKKYQTNIEENPKISLRIWRSLRAFRRTDIQFGIKVGFGAAVFALPAFIDSLRPTYSGWHGEWGLITFAIIMNKSVGGTVNTVPIRILGTFLGAFIAFCCWTIFPENNIVLPILGWLLSLVCFWIILTWKSKNMFGRFILLTFNLTVLYSYSLSISDNDDNEDTTQLIVRDIAFHRFLSVCAGVLWALFISAFVLPNSARRKLKRGLSILWLQMGLVWKADALRTQPRKGTINDINFNNSLNGNNSITTINNNQFTGIQGENEMQVAMIELNALLQNAPNELRLKGPFPTEEYRQLLRQTQQILDVFQDISVLIAKDPKASSRELEIIEYTTLERNELCNRIFLNFYLLSSAMRLGFPLPDKMPSTEHAIDRMLAKLTDYRAASIKSDASNSNDIIEYVDHGYVEDFILFYSYILATIAITERLAEITMYIQSLFGVIEEEMFEV